MNLSHEGSDCRDIDHTSKITENFKFHHENPHQDFYIHFKKIIHRPRGGNRRFQYQPNENYLYQPE